jgi:DNA-binding response OmpR family regulator
VADLLLVDNDERITELVAWFLARGGHVVRIAPSYARARECIDERRPELLLADLELGLERGDEELARLAREGRMPPTLVVSGYLDAELEARLRALPALVGTLAKPFDLAQLMERVEAGLRDAASRQPAPVSAALPAEDGWDDDGEAWIRITPAGGSGE